MRNQRGILLIHHSIFIIHLLFRFLVVGVFAATAAKLAELKALRRRLFIFRRHVITTFTIRALEHNIIARHNSPLTT